MTMNPDRAYRLIEFALDSFIDPLSKAEPSQHLNERAQSTGRLILRGVREKASHAAIILRDALKELEESIDKYS